MTSTTVVLPPWLLRLPGRQHAHTVQKPAVPRDRFRELMTAQEVADETTLSIQTLYFWRNQEPPRGPRSFNLGRRIVYRRSDFEAWLAERERTTARGGDTAHSNDHS